MSSIKSLIKAEKRKTTVKYMDNFEITINYLNRAELQKLVEKSTEILWDKQSHTRIDKMNRDTYYKKFANEVLISWSGLTQSTLAKMLPIEISNPDEVIEYSEENAIMLLSNAYDFDLFVQGCCMDLERFQSEKEEAEKKILEIMPSGSKVTEEQS